MIEMHLANPAKVVKVRTPTRLRGGFPGNVNVGGRPRGMPRTLWIIIPSSGPGIALEPSRGVNGSG